MGLPFSPGKNFLKESENQKLLVQVKRLNSFDGGSY
jgi:hypothetical protein